MNARHFQTTLRRAVRMGGSAEELARPREEDGHDLDPSAVDAVFADPAAIDAVVAPVAAAASEPSDGFLGALRDQLTALESHQQQIRKLLARVERHAPGA
ncbi:MAG: hypothetical protein KF847_16175 [Pirellulales bacterium]|nr:hypothetical protein [Pirellulales bacterium]